MEGYDFEVQWNSFFKYKHGWERWVIYNRLWGILEGNPEDLAQK